VMLQATNREKKDRLVFERSYTIYCWRRTT
jgi:hypothetical protein